MPGVVVDPVSDRATVENQLRVQRVLAGRLDLIRKIRRPARIKSAWSGGAGVIANLFLDARFAEYRADFAEIKAQNVRVVNAGVYRDRTGVLHVPPRRDRDATAPGDVRLDHQPRLADRSATNQRLRKAIDRIAAVVLRDGHDALCAA